MSIARIDILARTFVYTLFQGLEVTWDLSLRISVSAPSKASLIKGRFGGIVYIVADTSAKRTKKAIIFRLSLCVERKTRLAPTLRVCGFSRIIFTPPTPERGVWGRFVRDTYHQTKKQPFWTAFLRLSGKRDSHPRFA